MRERDTKRKRENCYTKHDNKPVYSQTEQKFTFLLHVLGL